MINYSVINTISKNAALTMELPNYSSKYILNAQFFHKFQ